MREATWLPDLNTTKFQKKLSMVLTRMNTYSELCGMIMSSHNHAKLLSTAFMSTTVISICVIKFDVRRSVNVASSTFLCMVTNRTIVHQTKNSNPHIKYNATVVGERSQDGLQRSRRTAVHMYMGNYATVNILR